MQAKTTVPNIFFTGELLDSNKVNDNNQYVADVISDVASLRYVHSVVHLPFYLGTTALSNADNQATRSYIIPAIDTCVIERIIVSGALASGSADINMYNATTGTTAPTGVSNPIVPSLSTVSGTFTYTQPITMAAGAFYRLEISGTAFTTSKLDVTLHIRTDKLNTAGTDLEPSPSWVRLTELDSVSATTFNANTTALSGAASTLNSNTRALRVSAYTFSSFSSATDADTLRMELPRAYSSDATQTIHQMVSSVSMVSAGTALQTITCSVLNAAGSSIGVSNVHSVSGLTESTATDTTSVDVSSGTLGITTDTTADYRVISANSAATVCSKATIWVFTY